MNSNDSIAYFVRVKNAWIYPGQSEQDLRDVARSFYLTYDKLVSLI